MQVKKFMFLLVGTLVSITALAQNYTQTIRGTIIERQIQKPIIGATVQIAGLAIGDQTDENGNFTISNVPVGNQTVIVSCIGFKENIISNVAVNSGKELVLTIALDEKLHTSKEVVIKGESRKNKPLNELSAVSARAFTVEETQRYAAAVNDPARMATNYAGVIAADDGNNQIVIRGNSPSGLLYRMEGIDIPNPNHFGAAGSSGGGVSILSTHVMANSDFLTGAFSADYGNALSGVFDLKLRKGNNKKREYAFQAGVLGINLAAEGPFSKNYKGSYLINYRYSTLGILSKMNVNVGNGITKFQDLSYNISLPTNRFGNFTLFSFGGLSDQLFNNVKDSSKWETEDDRQSGYFASNTGLWGATHSISIGKKSYLKTALAYSLTDNSLTVNYIQDDYDLLSLFHQKYMTKKLTLSSTLNHKVSNKILLRSGIIVNMINFNFQEKGRAELTDPIKTLVNAKESTQTMQAFSNIQYKLDENITINGGLHYLFFVYNQSNSIEPRSSIKWEISKKQSLAFAYGKHSQTAGYGLLFAEIKNANGQISNPNKNLGFIKAHHYVLSHNYSFSRNTKLKTELYYQSLFNVPVSTSDTNTYSALNTSEDFVRDALVNKGKGRNYGLEVSLEKYLSNNLYYMISTSWYQSKYTASNGKEYNTRFNGNQIINVVAGKEFVAQNKRRTLGLNIKYVYAGGYRTTPIDLVLSKEKGEAVYVVDQSFSRQLPYYMRGDIGIKMKWNRKRVTSTLSLDIQNVSNRQNVSNENYNVELNKVTRAYQTGLIPILNYKIEF
jgi:hypothetical protein